LKAVRTVGGHHRVELSELVPFLAKPPDAEANSQPSNGCPSMPLRCWEYLSDPGELKEECKACVVYRIRAAWCFAVAELDCDIGHAREFCAQSCQDCLYYQRLNAGVTKILIISPQGREIMSADGGNDVELRFAESAYEASAVISDFRPSFVVVDQVSIKSMGEGLLENLARDPRVAGVKIILARPVGKKGHRKVLWRDLIDGEIDRPFTLGRLRAIVGEFPVERSAVDGEIATEE